MSDLISRQDALEVFGNIHPLDYNAKYYYDKIKKLPSVEPVRKTGHWISGKKMSLECDRCGYGVQPWNNTEFCPKCGCHMDIKGGEE